MGYAKLAEQTTPGTPTGGYASLHPDSATSGWVGIGDSGRVFPLTGAFNTSVAAQTLGTTDTYVTGSNVLVPSSGVGVGMTYRVSLSLNKTNASTATPIWTVRMGTAAAITDASQWTHTGVAQTAIVETGFYEFVGTIRSIGGSGVLQGSLICTRTGGTAATGLASVPVVEVSGAAADKAWVSGHQIGLSINPGASSSWVVTQCIAQLY